VWSILATGHQIRAQQILAHPVFQRADLLLQREPQLELDQHAVARSQIWKQLLQLRWRQLAQRVARSPRT